MTKLSQLIQCQRKPDQKPESRRPINGKLAEILRTEQKAAEQKNKSQRKKI